MTTAILSFRTAGQVRLLCTRLAIDEARPLDDPPCAAWTREYAAAQHHPAEEVRLLDLGRAIGAWLDGSEAWLTRLLASAPAPLILEIETSARPVALEQAALDAPWELIAAAGTGHLALDERIRLSPLRRLDVPGEPRPLSRCRLSVLFMAAQPLDVTTLDFEREEAAIAAEIGKLGPDPFDLFVEESGTLDGLVAAAQRAAECTIGDGKDPRQPPPLAGPVDVLHISCHGVGGDSPAVLLEDDVGGRAPPAPVIWPAPSRRTSPPGLRLGVLDRRGLHGRPVARRRALRARLARGARLVGARRRWRRHLARRPALPPARAALVSGRRARLVPLRGGRARPSTAPGLAPGRAVPRPLRRRPDRWRRGGAPARARRSAPVPRSR